MCREAEEEEEWDYSASPSEYATAPGPVVWRDGMRIPDPALPTLPVE